MIPLKKISGVDPSGQDRFWQDPVHLDSNGWYFWMEDWVTRGGPYPSYAQCRNEFIRYCIWLSTDYREKIGEDY